MILKRQRENIRNIWGWPISFTLARCKQCETPNNACEDQNKWYKPVKWLVKFIKKHWLTNTHWIEIVKKSGPVGELNPGLSMSGREFQCVFLSQCFFINLKRKYILAVLDFPLWSSMKRHFCLILSLISNASQWQKWSSSVHRAL